MPTELTYHSSLNWACEEAELELRRQAHTLSSGALPLKRATASTRQTVAFQWGARLLAEVRGEMSPVIAHGVPSHHYCFMLTALFSKNSLAMRVRRDRVCRWAFTVLAEVAQYR